MLHKINSLILNLEELQQEFAQMNYKIPWFWFFNSFGTVNYSAISKLLDQIYMHLVFQLITPVADSQELLRALLLVLKFFDFYEQAVL